VKRYTWIVIFALCIVLCMTGIFYQSTKSQADSNATSQTVSEKVQPIVDPQQKIEPKDFNDMLRKVAHGIEFMILGIFLGLLFHQIKKLTGNTYLSCPLLISLLTGVTDEFLQSLNDRGSLVKDVLIDFGGAVAGIFLIFGIVLVLHQRKQRREKYGNSV